MSDLIKRSDVLHLLYGIFDKYRMSTDKSTSICESFGNEVFEEIRNIPIDYDIDKVVRELETKKQNALEVEESIKEYGVWNDAIEIVKQGGVSDDVCEWKIDGVYLHSPHKPLVSCVTDENYRYYYCPYCGKKIKVVE